MKNPMSESKEKEEKENKRRKCNPKTEENKKDQNLCDE